MAALELTRNASLRSVLANYLYFMLNQCLESIDKGCCMHACISSTDPDHELEPSFEGTLV
jgi:hypothetical protein